PERFELFMTPIGGGAVTKVSGTLTGGGDVFDFQVSPDGLGVLFLADRDQNEHVELYGAPFTGGVFQLSPEEAFGRAVMDFRIAPDDAHVVFRGDLLVDGRDELFSVPITGGPSTRLDNTPVAGGDVSPFTWSVSPDSSRVAYVADQEVDETHDLYSAPIA